VGRGSRKTLEFPGANRCFVVEIRSYAKMRAEPWFARGHGSARSQTSPTIRRVCTGTLAKPIRSFGSLAPPNLGPPYRSPTLPFSIFYLLFAIGYLLFAIRVAPPPP
jgi:hypothetical protein